MLAGTALCTGPGDPGVAQGMAPAAGLELHHTGAAGPHGGHRGGIPPGPLREPAEAPLRKVPDTARVLCCPSFLQSWRGCRRGPGADTRPVLPPTFLPSLLAMPLSPVAFCLFPVGGGEGGRKAVVRSWGGHVCTQRRSARKDRHRQRGPKWPEPWAVRSRRPAAEGALCRTPPLRTAGALVPWGLRGSICWT